jgi:hypothetical protein
VLRGRDVDEVMELKRQGLSIRAISRLTGYDRKTSTDTRQHRAAVGCTGRGWQHRASWSLTRGT